MKHLITMTACLLLLMALLSQFVQNQRVLMQLESGGHAVDLFCEDGDEVVLKASLSRIMGCESSEIMVMKENGHVVITAPVKSILANPKFWGIDETENEGRFRWERRAGNG